LTQKKASALQQKRHQPHNNKNCHTEKKAKIDFAKIAKINIFINSDKDFGKFYKSYQRALFMLLGRTETDSHVASLNHNIFVAFCKFI